MVGDMCGGMGGNMHGGRGHAWWQGGLGMHGGGGHA